MLSGRGACLMPPSTGDWILAPPAIGSWRHRRLDLGATGDWILAPPAHWIGQWILVTRSGRPASVESDRMSSSLLVVQLFNGLQLGVLLFLVAAGLTLVFGVMDFINLAHGVQYML